MSLRAQLQSIAGEISLHSKVGLWYLALAENDGGVADGGGLLAKYYACAQEISLNSALGAWMRQITFAVVSGGGISTSPRLNAATGELGRGRELAFDRQAAHVLQ